MKNTKRITVFMVIAAIIIMGTGYLDIPDIYAQTAESEPFSGLVIESEEATPFHLVATIMEINKGYRPNIVVAEKIILIMEYSYLNEIQQTEMMDKYGNTIDISDLKIGQRVIVDGLELPDKTLVGEQIQVKPKE